MKRFSILSGIIGALTFTFILLALIVWFKPFDYKSVFIANSKKVCNDTSLNYFLTLKDLENKGLLLTPQEYTSNVVNYYNTLVGFLIGLFVLFTFGSFFSIKYAAQKDIEDAKEKIAKELKNSDEFKKSLIPLLENSMKESLLTVSDKDDLLLDINARMGKLEEKQTTSEVAIELIADEIGIDSILEIKKES